MSLLPNQHQKNPCDPCVFFGEKKAVLPSRSTKCIKMHETNGGNILKHEVMTLNGGNIWKYDQMIKSLSMCKKG